MGWQQLQRLHPSFMSIQAVMFILAGPRLALYSSATTTRGE